jgi:hypothetical protein
MIFNLPCHIRLHVGNLGNIEFIESITNSKEVEAAFVNRGYKFSFERLNRHYKISASALSEFETEMNYEFIQSTPEKCFLEAASFLKQVERLNKSFGFPKPVFNLITRHANTSKRK